MDNNTQGSSDQNPTSDADSQNQMAITPELVTQVTHKVLELLEMDLKINRERLPYPRAQRYLNGGR
jgi:hypothetical protein